MKNHSQKFDLKPIFFINGFDMFRLGGQNSGKNNMYENIKNMWHLSW